MHLRRFVLQPLAELAPSLVHPTLQQTIATLLENLDDQSAVKRWRASGEKRDAGTGDAGKGDAGKGMTDGGKGSNETGDEMR